MLDKNATLQIRGACDYDAGKLDDKNRGWKNRKQILKKCWTKTQYRKFEGTVIAMGEIGWRKSWPKKLNWLFNFLAAIFITQFLCIAIAGPSNSRYCVFIQYFWESTHWWCTTLWLSKRRGCSRKYCEGPQNCFANRKGKLQETTNTLNILQEHIGFILHEHLSIAGVHI